MTSASWTVRGKTLHLLAVERRGRTPRRSSRLSPAPRAWASWSCWARARCPSAASPGAWTSRPPRRPCTWPCWSRSGLIRTDMTPANRGLQKVCTRKYDEISILIPREDSSGSCPQRDQHAGGRLLGVRGGAHLRTGRRSRAHRLHRRPRHASTSPSTSRRSSSGSAAATWSTASPTACRPPRASTSVQFSAELCSEAPLHNDDYPSDITVRVNGVELGTWTSPGDFGGERGRLTPDWWEVGRFAVRPAQALARLGRGHVARWRALLGRDAGRPAPRAAGAHPRRRQRRARRGACRRHQPLRAPVRELPAGPRAGHRLRASGQR